MTDGKHSEVLKIWLTEREMLDLVKMAHAHDRKTPDLGRVIIRHYLYGHMNEACAETSGTNRPY